jgi:transposase
LVLTDEQWAVLAPLVEQVKPRGKTPLVHLRRTVEAVQGGDKTGHGNAGGLLSVAE